MSIDASASRFDSSVANSLYSDASARGRVAALHRLVHEAQAEHPGHLGLGDELGDALADHRVVLQRLAVDASPSRTYSVSRSRRCSIGE